jgi:hypothetical protein
MKYIRIVRDWPYLNLIQIYSESIQNLFLFVSFVLFHHSEASSHVIVLSLTLNQAVSLRVLAAYAGFLALDLNGFEPDRGYSETQHGGVLQV